ncbi:MAG: alpha/beta fold hydrolase, partial [Eubacteriales bacterium]|nr:alpha/beta fold hydrolase [Eubacteriales bacterium]
NVKNRKTYQWKFGNISYIEKGNGPALLLVHDLNSYSSSYEWNSVIDCLSKDYTVYAIDLLGCGHSEKPNITYTAYMYTQLINDFIMNVIHKRVTIVATGDSAPFVVMSSYINSLIYNNVILVNPESIKKAMKNPNKRSNIRRFLLNMPILGTMLYNIFMNRPNLEKIFSKECFDKGIIPIDIMNAYHENAHLSGSSAKYLFTSTQCHYTTSSISKALSESDLCIYIISGQQKNNDETIYEYLSLNPAIETTIIDNCKHLPQIEEPEEFVKQIHLFTAEYD